MSTIMSFIKRHPVLSYFALTFAISWGGVLILGAPYGMPTTSEQLTKVWPIVFIPYFLGPSLASILLTGLINGWTGIRELLSRLLKWRVSLRWYAVAILTAPILVLPTLLALSLTSPVFLPDIFTSANKVSLIISGILIGFILGGILEELGWTGFAIPGLRRHYNVLTTGLIVGLLWGVWHFLPTFWGSGDHSGAFSPLLFLPPCLFYIGVLPAYRVLMVWLYDRTGSFPMAMLMHTSVTASTLFILSPAARGVQLMIYYVVLTAVTWGVVAAVAVANRGQLSRQPLWDRNSHARGTESTPDARPGDPRRRSPPHCFDHFEIPFWRRFSMAKFWIGFGIILIGIALVGVVAVMARYFGEIRAAREQLAHLGSQVIETDRGPIEYARNRASAVCT